MNISDMKKEIHAMIEDMAETTLLEIRPIITEAYWKPVIETDLTDEELASIEEGMKEYRERPESFTPLEVLIEERNGKAGLVSVSA